VNWFADDSLQDPITPGGRAGSVLPACWRKTVELREAIPGTVHLPGKDSLVIIGR